MKNTTWHLVKSGQIVSFRYKSQSGRSVNRTVLCLDPEFRYRKKSTGRVVQFFIGLELNASDKPSLPVGKLNEVFSILGDVNRPPAQTDNQRINQTYLSLKGFLNSTPIFKTYLLRKCRKNRVFLENKYQSLNALQVKQIAGKISKQTDTINILENNLED